MILRMIIGYVLWFFLGLFGVHRFFLGRVASGLILLALTVIAVGLLGAGIVGTIGGLSELDNPETLAKLEDPVFVAELENAPGMAPAAFLSMIIGLWWLFDLVLVAIICLKDAEAKEDARREAAGINVQAVNMDPSFQASRRAAEWDDSQPRKSALPDDYVLPWRQNEERGRQKTYRPDEED